MKFNVILSNLEVVRQSSSGKPVFYGWLSGETERGRSARYFVPARILSSLERDVDALTPEGMSHHELGLTISLTGRRVPGKGDRMQFQLDEAHVLTGPEAELAQARRRLARAEESINAAISAFDTEPALAMKILEAYSEASASLARKKACNAMDGSSPAVSAEPGEEGRDCPALRLT